jgi:thiamine monophosphate kinase
VHFDLAWMTPEGRGMARARSLWATLAAKGAMPLWALVSVAAPKSFAADAFVGLYRGMDALARPRRPPGLPAAT